MAAILEFYFQFPYCSTFTHRMSFCTCLPNFVCNQTKGGGVMTPYRFFKMTAMESEIYLWVHVRWLHSFISQSTAVIKLLPVSENGRALYWNSISGFNFDLIFDISAPFCIYLQSCHNWDTLCRAMTSCPFFKMAANSHIGFDLGNVTPATKWNCWSKRGPQIWSRLDY